VFFPLEELERATVKMFQTRGKQALQYHVTEGYYSLREYIAQRYRHRYNLEIKPEQVLITNGSQQALDIIGKLFLNPDDIVLLERPTYLGALQCLSMFQPRWREATLNQDGIDISELGEQLQDNRVKMFYSIPNFQNPTGIRYSLEKRKAAASVLEKFDTLIVEDDPYGELVFNNDPLPHLYSFLPDQTILLGSFSKIIAPGFRLGWMIATPELIRKATIIKQASDLHSGNVAQFILHQFLQDNDLETHIEKIRVGYAQQRDVMISTIRGFFPRSVRYTQPEGGMFAWLTLPDSITSRELLRRSMEKKIVFVPGDTFYASTPDSQTLRMNFSNVEAVKMKEALQVLAGLI
jgi:2-aminoadipate transaminase